MSEDSQELTGANIRPLYTERGSIPMEKKMKVQQKSPTAKYPYYVLQVAREDIVSVSMFSFIFQHIRG